MNDPSYMVEHAILTLTNEEVDKLNDRIIATYPGEDHILYSFDSVDDDPRNLYQQEFLNSISPSGMPPHVLRLKKGVPIMLLRNIDPKVGLCNGTRLLCRDFLPNVIDGKILIRQMKGDRVFIPQISLKPTEGEHLPFQMTRRQFRVRLSLSLTINKSQGQMIPSVGGMESKHEAAQVFMLMQHIAIKRQMYMGHSERLKQWVSMAVVLLIVAIILHFTNAIPLNKQLYSFSYVCFTTGAAGIFFSGFYLLIDVWGFRTPFLFLEWIGMNAMLVFVMAAQDIFAGFVNGWSIDCKHFDFGNGN
ncbi:ATP-dependent DNA helicase PIF1-like [Senna tora]|uniref:ATP-dependent DNA helicase PIF1-like n=1 Tax=Senna tora TaxID=362788 RepID=A0A834THB8_9FABA|nr:ATP-dependent DNA helicase PIF1-like [Senna tora]